MAKQFVPTQIADVYFKQGLNLNEAEDKLKEQGLSEDSLARFKTVLRSSIKSVAIPAVADTEKPFAILDYDDDLFLGAQVNGHDLSPDDEYTTAVYAAFVTELNRGRQINPDVFTAGNHAKAQELRT